MAWVLPITTDWTQPWAIGFDPGDVPYNVITTDSGDPLITDDGDYITTD